MVQSLGIDVKRLFRIVFAAGVALAALAGMIAAPMSSSVYPEHGRRASSSSASSLVVIGGIGSITRRAGGGSLLVGFVDTFGKVLLRRRPPSVHRHLRADGRHPARVEARWADLQVLSGTVMKTQIAHSSLARFSSWPHGHRRRPAR
jgi:branched-subunit amino acid ABC-type transport system permease component